MEPISTLQNWIDESEYIVAFTGAGASTESGIKDFRSTNGLYHEQYKFPPETILSHTFFERQTEEFYRFYRDKMLCPEARPNPAHETLAKLEEMGKLKAVITQNIDGLHQAAGSREVLELHGSVLRNYCRKCGRFYGMERIQESRGVPRCTCGGVIKPDVVLYEESLDEEVLSRAVHHLRKADLHLIGGTSLVVYPAAGLVRYYSGNRLVLINLDSTPMDQAADLVICGKIGEVLSRIRL